MENSPLSFTTLLGNNLPAGCPLFECPDECIYAVIGYEKYVSSLGEKTCASNQGVVTPEGVLRNNSDGETCAKVFLVFEISEVGLFWVGIFWWIFLGGKILAGDFLVLIKSLLM